MRIKIILSLRHESGAIPAETLRLSRLSTLHLINTAIEGLIVTTFNNNSKPFTFALYFPFEKRNNQIVLTRPFSLTLSSNDPGFIFVLYNSLLKLDRDRRENRANNNCRFCDCDWKLESVFPLPDKVLGDTFKTLALALIRCQKDTSGSGNHEHQHTITYPRLMFSFKISAPEKVRKPIYDIGVGTKRKRGVWDVGCVLGECFQS
ncbi:MAG: hypothetical protein ABDH28_07515 [Brevinematia bacterium]